MAEPSKADLLRRDLKYASGQTEHARERARELDRFAEWLRMTEEIARPLMSKVPSHIDWHGLLQKDKSLQLTKIQSQELRAWISEKAVNLRKHADSIEQGLKI